jgi:putative hemolysin
MSEVGLQIALLLLLIVANGVFAMAELAVASSRKIRLQRRAETGDAGAQAALDLANDPGRFLSTVQIGITLISVLIGAFGGNSLGATIGHGIARIPGLAPYSDEIGFGIAVAVITYLSLIIGELVPKQLALGNAETIAALVSRPMRGLSRVASPLVSLLSFSTSAVLRLLGVKASTDPAVTEEEITILIQQGAEAGVVQTAEREIVDRVFRLGDQRVYDLMTPRLRVRWVDLDEPLEEQRHAIIAARYHVLPACRGDLDHVIGVVEVKDLWAREVRGEDANPEAVLKPPAFIPESLPAFKALEMLRDAHTSLGLVLDEFGGTEGVITLTDLLEALVGDLPDERGGGNTSIVRREDGSWLIDGMLPMAELREELDWDETPGERRGDYQTVGGFVLDQLGRVPAAGEYFAWEGWRVEVIDMDGNRVDKVLIAREAAD